MKGQIYLFFEYPLLWVLIAVFFSCEQEEVDAPKIPSQNFTPVVLYLNNPEMRPLRSVAGGLRITNGGYNGLLVYRVSENSFRAYDGNCPHYPKTECSALKIDGLQAICDCDESAFNLITGESLNHNHTKTPLVGYPLHYDVANQQITIRPR